jgi:hypothetical protein
VATVPAAWARRLQRIAERHRTGQRHRGDPLIRLGRQVRGHASAHRLAADEHRARPGRRATDGGVHGGPKRLFQHRWPVGHLAADGHIGEVERHDVDAQRGQPLGVAPHEGADLAGPGAVREDEDQLGRRSLARVGQCRQRRAAGVDGHDKR